MARRRKMVSRTVWKASHGLFPAVAEPIRRRTAFRRSDERPARHRIARVIFACMHNAGRSQMAAAFFNQLADPARVRAIAAGTRGGRSVDPQVIEAMREEGLDVGRALERRINLHLAMAAERVVTMGCGDDIPYDPGVKVEEWPIEDPRGQSAACVREIRDQIRHRVTEMVEANGWKRVVPAAVP
jgi:arsenate reductase